MASGAASIWTTRQTIGVRQQNGRADVNLGLLELKIQTGKIVRIYRESNTPADGFDLTLEVE